MATKKKNSNSKTKDVEILAHNLAGKYLLPYSKGQVVKGMEAKQADELIDAGDAKQVK